MKSRVIGIVCLLAILSDSTAWARYSSLECEITGRSVISIRPLFQSNDPLMVSAFRENRTEVLEDDDCAGGAFQMVIFGSKTSDSDSFIRYFTPFCKTSLTVSEQLSSTDIPDLRAQNFNIFTVNGTFSSRITLNPQQAVIGLGLHYRQSFWRDVQNNRGLWFSISSPLTNVKNNLNLRESVLNKGGGANPNADTQGMVVDSMIQAFMQEEFLYGQIYTDSRAETRLADIEIKVGYEWLDRIPYHLESYAGFIIPTGNKVTSTFLFQPIVGNNHHAGVMFGSAGGFRIWDDENEVHSVRAEYTFHSNYLFKNTQQRSLDLKYKPWSRYIGLYADQAQAQRAANLVANNPAGSALHNQGVNLSTPGINILTRRVDVTPGFMFNLTTAFVYNHICGWHAEGGYNFFARRAENIELAQEWQLGPAIKHRLGGGQTNPVRNITGNALLENITPVPVTDYKNSMITADQLDLASAAQPAIFSHMVYAAGGYTALDWDLPLFGLVGGAYELATSNNNGVPQRWILWGKIGLSF